MFEELESLIDLNQFIHGDTKMAEWHMEHIKLVRKYALIINKRLNANLNIRKLSYSALAHDILKERSLSEDKDGTVNWRNCNIPQDTKRYVRMNLNVLEKFNLDDFFNSDMQYHSLAAGIFLYKELGMKDPEILYPIFFHSCPIISVYESLPNKVQQSVDIIMLSDKLSSNWLRINQRGIPVKFDLDLAVFGESGLEFNYTLGLYLARLIAQGKSDGEEGRNATGYYLKRLQSVNPLVRVDDNYNKKIGGSKIWPKRKSLAFKTL